MKYIMTCTQSLRVFLVFDVFEQDTIGFNLAALQFLKHQIEEKEAVHLFTDATDTFKQKKKKQKKRAILAIKT